MVTPSYDIGHELDSPVDKFQLHIGKNIDSHLLVTTQSNNKFQLASTQLSSDFGAFSLTLLKLYTGPPMDNKPVQDPLTLHKMVK